MSNVIENVSAWISELPLFVQVTAELFALLVVSLIADLVARRYLIKAVVKAAQRTSVKWDDILLQFKVLTRAVRAVPGLVFYFGVPFLPGLDETLSTLIRNVALAYVTLMMTLALSALLSAVNAIYSQYPIAKERPIKGFVQIAKIVVYILGGVVAVATLMDRSPVVLLTGFGAMTAVLMLVFRDTILSLVASVQLSSLDMVRVGDWIEMPQLNADGDVVDVALHTVKVQNWDKTITTIPTHKLITESFKNWRGMSESGGRRIKRSIKIDVDSVRFLTEDEVDRFRQFKLLRAYVDRKQAELAEYNQALGDTANVNLRRLTNIGTFRAYLYDYLKNHPQINHNMTLLVRQLQPSEAGIPIEIYCFTASTAWSVYESVQADIFDHILAQCPEFGLRVYQAPSGADLRALRRTGPEMANEQMGVE